MLPAELLPFFLMDYSLELFGALFQNLKGGIGLYVGRGVRGVGGDGARVVSALLTLCLTNYCLHTYYLYSITPPRKPILLRLLTPKRKP